MHVASVTLDEVLRAAGARAAALVPETAGYLALAIGDASARLPYRLEDGLVTLTTEGTVRVARGRETVSPEEGARVLRELLRRLLTVSAGTMPCLAAAATARAERGGPELVVAEIEAALIPVNRAAARRSLARLARDTTRARDAGRLARHAPAVLEPPGVAAPPLLIAAPTAPVAPPPAPPPVVHASWPAPATPPGALDGEPVFDVIVEFEPETPFQPALAVARYVPEPEEVTHRIELPEPTVIDAQAVGCDIDAESLELAVATDVESIAAVEVAAHQPTRTPRMAPVIAEAIAPLVTPRAPAPTERTPSTEVDLAARSLEDALRQGRIVAGPPAPARRSTAGGPSWQAELASASPSDVDVLLASFRPSDATSDSTTMRRDLKKLVGIDATQLPPRVAVASARDS